MIEILSSIPVALFKKAIMIIIVITILLPFLITFFNFVSTTISVIPVFARSYIRLGLGVFVFKVVKEWFSE